ETYVSRPARDPKPPRSGLFGNHERKSHIVAHRIGMPMSALEARNVGVNLSGVEVLHDVDLSVKQGEVIAISVANGSGKSTLVRTLLGVIPASTGRVEVFGKPVGSGTPWSDIGYVPQRIGAGSGVPVSV